MTGICKTSIIANQDEKALIANLKYLALAKINFHEYTLTKYDDQSGTITAT